MPELPAHQAGRTVNPDHVGGFKAAVPIFSGIETKFGLVLPRFSRPRPQEQKQQQLPAATG
jgi:solute carrier family 25 aspartate/glutamate transporter 12/13